MSEEKEKIENQIKKIEIELVMEGYQNGWLIDYLKRKIKKLKRKLKNFK